jgi:hypothetical protein
MSMIPIEQVEISPILEAAHQWETTALMILTIVQTYASRACLRSEGPELPRLPDSEGDSHDESREAVKVPSSYEVRCYNYSKSSASPQSSFQSFGSPYSRMRWTRQASR